MGEVPVEARRVGGRIGDDGRRRRTWRPVSGGRTGDDGSKFRLVKWEQPWAGEQKVWIALRGYPHARRRNIYQRTLGPSSPRTGQPDPAQRADSQNRERKGRLRNIDRPTGRAPSANGFHVPCAGGIPRPSNARARRHGLVARSRGDVGWSHVGSRHFVGRFRVLARALQLLAPGNGHPLRSGRKSHLGVSRHAGNLSQLRL